MGLSLNRSWIEDTESSSSEIGIWTARGTMPTTLKSVWATLRMPRNRRTKGEKEERRYTLHIDVRA